MNAQIHDERAALFIHIVHVEIDPDPVVAAFHESCGGDHDVRFPIGSRTRPVASSGIFRAPAPSRIFRIICLGRMKMKAQ